VGVNRGPGMTLVAYLGCGRSEIPWAARIENPHPSTGSGQAFSRKEMREKWGPDSRATQPL